MTLINLFLSFSGSVDEVDHTAVGAAITTITTGLPQVSRGVRTLAALIDDASGNKLLEATRKLCTAFSDLLKAAEPAGKEVICSQHPYYLNLKCDN